MKPTASQLTILHAGESALASASLTVGAGVYQYITSQSLNFPALLAFLGATFLGAMAMIYKSLLANPALPQAEADTANEVKAFLGNEFADFVNGHFSGVVQRIKALETTVANHSAPAPSSVVQLPFPNPTLASTAGVPQVAFSGPATFTNANSANMTASVPSPSLVVTPQPQAPMLGTIPTLQAVQPQ